MTPCQQHLQRSIFVVHKKKKKAIIAGKAIWIKPQYAKIWTRTHTHTHTPFPMARSSQWRLAPRSLIASGATSGPTWNMRPEKWDPANKRLFFLSAWLSCRAGRTQKGAVRSCGPSNKGCLVHSRAKEEFTTVAPCSWWAVRCWSWSEFFQALPRPPSLDKLSSTGEGSAWHPVFSTSRSLTIRRRRRSFGRFCTRQLFKV